MIATYEKIGVIKLSGNEQDFCYTGDELTRLRNMTQQRKLDRHTTTADRHTTPDKRKGDRHTTTADRYKTNVKTSNYLNRTF